MVGRFKLPSPGAAIGTVALVLAMGGAAYAGGGVGTTVGTGELKNGAVTAPKLHAGAVRNKKIADNSITGTKIKESTLGPVPATIKALNVLGATVRSDGTLARAQQGNTSSARNAEGIYVVNFGADVSPCTFAASLGGAGGSPSGEISTSLSDAGLVDVQTFNSSGNPADRSFSLVMNC